MMYEAAALFLLFCIHRSSAADPVPDCTYSYLNHCGRHFMVYSVVDGVFRTPVNEDELSQHCLRQEAAAECVRQRTDNCTTGVIKGIARFMMDAVNDERDARCDPSTPEHEQYLRIASCLNSLSQHTWRCMKIFGRNIDVFAEAVVGKTLRQKIPHGCCVYNAYISCVIDETKRICGAETAAFNERLTSGAVGDLISSACESYKSGDKKCEAFTLPASPTDDVNDGNFAFLGTIAKLSDAFSSKRS